MEFRVHSKNRVGILWDYFPGPGLSVIHALKFIKDKLWTTLPFFPIPLIIGGQNVLSLSKMWTTKISTPGLPWKWDIWYNPKSLKRRLQEWVDVSFLGEVWLHGENETVRSNSSFLWSQFCEDIYLERWRPSQGEKGTASGWQQHSVNGRNEKWTVQGPWWHNWGA